MTYSVHTKVNWQIELSDNWQNKFYPSLVRKLNKSESFFDELFEIKFTPLNNINETESFFKLYDKEIVSRGNYIFKQNEQRDSLEQKLLNNKKYFMANIIKKDTGKYGGGIIFSIVEDRVSFALRVFNKEIRSSFRALTTLDFWAEKKMYDYATSSHLNFISHGTDSYPNKGRIGLVLFKLKVGSKPKISKKEHTIIELSETEAIEYDVPTFFWTLPDQNNFFQEAHLFYKEGEINESIFSELIKVMEWTNIKLNLHIT